MKRKLLTLLTASLVAAAQSHAAYIGWVSFHAGDDAPSANAVTAGFTQAPDVGYTALLAAHGHTVTRIVTVDNVNNNAGVIAAMSTNDLIIISRSVPSGHYEVAAETAVWNGVATPMMILGGYITRNVRLGFTSGGTMQDVSSTEVRLTVNVPTHPIFAGVSLDATNLMVNPFAARVDFLGTLQNGISVNNNTLATGGTNLAVIGTPGDTAYGGPVIAEFRKGLTAYHGRDVFAGNRLVFLTGTRESGITSEGSGIFDLLPDGEKMFLNAVTYMTPPVPPACNLAVVGATNLVAGDAWTLNAGAVGTQPLSYQWYKEGVALPNGTTATLTLANMTPADAGNYQLILTNVAGSATSTVARLEFAVFPAASITNSLISYWPLDDVLGSKTVDLVSGYDMTLVNMGATNLVDGKWGKAFDFNGTTALLQRINNPGDDLPIYQHPNFSVSVWVNGYPQTDKRVFAEGSTTGTNPMFDFGTHNGGTDGTVDIFIRTDGGTASPNHAHSTGTAFDGGWHNIVYVQRDVGGGNMKAQMWIDGVLDPVAFTPVRPITLNTTTLGALLRSSVSAWFTGQIDDAAVWNRALSPEDIAILQVTPITNAPSRLQPLAVTSFKADLPAVVAGGSTKLRWEVSKDASQVTINLLGDVTAQTAVGSGATNITPSQTTTYVLTVSRGADTLSATTSVAVVEGVASGWTVLDTFDQAQLGNLFDSGYWNDTSGTAGKVVSVNGNKAVQTSGSGISFLNLRDLTVLENQGCTLFFRIIAGANNASGITNIVGLTDKSQRSYGDEYSNIGPVLYAAPFTNDVIVAETNAWYLGARNWPGSAIDYPGPALEAGTVYNVWMDITNASWTTDYLYDTFTVYIQKEGDAARTVLFQDYTSDREPTAVDPVLGGMLPDLDKLVLMGNSATASATFDDFYLSTSGYNATVPKAYTIALPPGPLGVSWSGSQIRIEWTNGTLQQADAVTGTWADVPGNPTSPYLVTPDGAKFYRSRQ